MGVGSHPGLFLPGPHCSYYPYIIQREYTYIPFSLCDGSTRPIAKLIDRNLIRKLATRAEGVPIDSDF